MANPPNPNDPKSGSDKDETRPDRERRGGGGPNNPLPGEPGGPSTSGHIEAEEPDKNKDKANPGNKR